MSFPFRRVRLAASCSAAPLRVRPRLEALEDRWVPTAFVVNSLVDGAPAVDGLLTLREAVTAASSNAPSGDAPAGSSSLDTITFDPSLAFGTINLQAAQGQLFFAGGGEVRVVGPVAGNPQGISISGQNAIRVIIVGEFVDAVTLDSLTIKQGKADNGAGLQTDGVKTRLRYVDLVQNNATVSGAALENVNELRMFRCTVSNNTSAGTAGGIANDATGSLFIRFSNIVGNSAASNGGGFLNHGAAGIDSSTFAGNLAGADGGGLWSNNQMDILFCSITGNNAVGRGGGLLDTGLSYTQLRSCTIADNFGIGGGISTDNQTIVSNCTVVNNSDTSNDTTGAGGIAKTGGNLQLDNSIVSLNHAGSASQDPNVKTSLLNSASANFIGGDPRLSPLGDHGGQTLTMAPLAGSPVIDAGDNNHVGSGNDQRGARRIIDGHQNGPLFVDQGAVEFSPGPINPIVTGADQGAAPEVKVFGGIHGALRYDFLAYPAGFLGGVRVAVGDVTGDGVDDYVTGAGPTGGPQVNVYNGANGGLLKSFFAFSPSFTGGIFVAVGDVDGDHFDDVVVSEDAGGAPSVSVFDGHSLAKGTKKLLATFSAYAPNFTGGVRVALGDVNGDGRADIVTGKGPGAAPRVRVFNGRDLTSASQTVLYDFMAYATSFTGGVYVALGDTDDDGHADIITGAGAGGGPAVNVFSGLDGSVLASFFAYGVNFGGGVRVGAADLNGDRVADVITGRGPGGEPTVKVFDGPSVGQGPAALDRFDAFDLAFTGGVFVGGG